MAANNSSVENRRGAATVASDHPGLFFVAGGSRSGPDASRYAVSSSPDWLAVRLMTGPSRMMILQPTFTLPSP